MMDRIVLASTLALAAVTAPAADEPPWLSEARAREGALTESVSIQSRDGRFKASVPARLRGEIVESEGSYSVELDIGTGGEPVYCEVFPDGVDMADALRITAAASFDAIAAEQGRIESRELEHTDAGWNGGAAFMQAEWLYLVTIDGQKRLGALKQILFERDGGSVYCAHNDIGFRLTFERATHELARTLVWSQAPLPARYVDVLVADLSGRKVGVARTHVVRDADGDDRVTTTLSMLVPMPAGQVLSHDEVLVEFVTGDAGLLSALQVVNESGEIDTELRLDPADGGGWLVTGKFKGKPLEKRLPAEEVPQSTLAQYALTRALLQSHEPAGRTVDFLVWSDANPAQFTEAGLTAVAPLGGDTWSARFAMAGMSFDVVADSRDGTASKVVMSLGHLTISLERVAKLGKL